MIKIEHTKTWDVFPSSLNRLARKMGPSAEAGIKVFAGDVRDHIVNGIHSGTFAAKNFPNVVLSDAYAARKTPGKPPLENTSTYVDAIKVIKDPEGYRVGFEEGAIGPTGAKLSEIALWLEMGTSKMKARPHWRPTVEWAKGELPTRSKAIFNGISFT